MDTIRPQPPIPAPLPGIPAGKKCVHWECVWNGMGLVGEGLKGVKKQADSMQQGVLYRRSRLWRGATHWFEGNPCRQRHASPHASQVLVVETLERVR